VADHPRGGFQPLEMHDRQQWTAVYVGRQAARMMTIEMAAVGIAAASDWKSNLRTT